MFLRCIAWSIGLKLVRKRNTGNVHEFIIFKRAFTSSKETMETLEQCMKFVQSYMAWQVFPIGISL